VADDLDGPLSDLSDSIAERIKELRHRGGWPTAKAFAERCAEVGAPHLTAPVLMNIESGRRKDGRRTRLITADELVALAVALRVTVVDLLVPDAADDDEPYSVTPEVRTTAGQARRWIGGHAFLVEPEDAGELMDAIRGLPKKRAALLNSAWWTPDRQIEQQRRQNIAYRESGGYQSDDPDDVLRHTDPVAWLAKRENEGAS
jgi:transcriptional regulator with XRE-family HTH domain